MLDLLFMILGAAVLAALWIMLYDGNRFVVTNYNIKDKKICRHYHAVVLADLHNKTYGKNNEKLIEAVRMQNPDAILVAGDIPTAKPGTKLDTALDLMKSLAKDYPVYYANGNHEHRMELYPEKYGDMAEKYEAGLKCAGIERMVNCHSCLVKENIVIYGSRIDEKYYKRFKIQPMEKDYLGSILGQPDKDRYNILIAHNPDYFPHYAEWGADLVLSGHIHGGMVRIPFINKGVVSPNISFFPKYDGGIYREKESTMILSRGLGMHTIPVRLFNPAELITIDFDKQEE